MTEERSVWKTDRQTEGGDKKAEVAVELKGRVGEGSGRKGE